MKKTLMYGLIFFLFANQLYIFGKVVVLRGSELSKMKNNHYGADKRKLICVSEDDGSALVWNDNLIWKHFFVARQDNMQFHSLNRYINNEIDCKMNASESCLESWNKQNWSLTDSIKTPMGPVFDQRWEEFKEYETSEDRYYSVDMNGSIKALSFSNRANHDTQILLCNSKDYKRASCYWIVIGGRNNSLSFIQKCAKGVPVPEIMSERECEKELVAFQHAPLSTNEWRSFIITWDSVTRNISVYDTDNIIMTYVDTEEPKCLSCDYHVFIRSRVNMLIRFHIYNFLHTTVENTILTSPIFHFNNKIICMQLLIGLCVECDAQIILRDFTNNESLEIVTARGSSKAASHGLPMWQSITIQRNFSTIRNNSVILQLIPELNTSSSNPLWAIANVRQCPPNGSLRFGITYSSQDWSNYPGYLWPTVTCQKLFYDEHIIVNSVAPTGQNIELSDADCSQDEIGPQCSFSCKDDLESYVDCEETAICYKDGCICSSGFTGSTCSQVCELNTYGYGCQKTCGSCLNNAESLGRLCNRVTGMCHNGCNNTRKVYIPPLCQISIEKLEIPIITFITKTSVKAVVPMIWKDEYKKITIFYSFVIKDQTEYYLQLPWNRVFQNMTQLVGYFKNLQPDTIYQIRCSLSAAETEIKSDWQSVETGCDVIEDFNVTTEETNIIINWRNNANRLSYPCLTDSYHLVVQNIDTAEQTVNELVTYFPYNVSDLTSNTFFNVTIFRGDHTIFSQEVRTLEGVPSTVRDLQGTLLSSTQVILIWKPPDEPNGQIIRYEIIVKIKEYHGCRDLKLPTPYNHIITKVTTDTTISISELHPYTSYSAQVIAHNSRHDSISVEAIFDTKHSEIPAEIFSQLTVQGWKLSWHPPEDCTTISGPIKARIKIRGISNAVKDFNVTEETLYNFVELDKAKLQLNGVERYKATVYVIRDYSSPENATAYREYEFETPSTAPPKITNLEVVEIDTRQTPMTVHLRWQSLLPPINGKLRNYIIKSCNKYGMCESTEYEVNDFCDLWDNYICGSIQIPSISSQKIQVSAYNVNVTEPSPPNFVTEDMLNNITPDIPAIYNYTVKNNSVIDLKWHHPWRTSGHLQYFQIQIVQISSNLRTHIARSIKDMIYKYPVTKYMRNYNELLYLLPSTQYHINIQAITTANKSSSMKYIEVYTPSTVAFDHDLDVMVHRPDSTISLKIPFVLNDTFDSMMHIIIKGPNLCNHCEYSKVPENLRAQIGLTMHDIAWQAAELSTSQLAGRIFTIGNSKYYGNGRNCPLKLEELYEITILITGQSLLKESIMLTKSIRIGEVPWKYHEVWLIIIILFLVVAGVVIYFHRRRKYKKNSNRSVMEQEYISIQPINRYSTNTENEGYDDIILQPDNRYSMNTGNEIALYEDPVWVSVISNLKQNLPTLPVRNILSRATTSAVPLAIENEQRNTSSQLALVESSFPIRTMLPYNEMLPILIKELKKQLPIQQQILQNITQQDEALQRISSPSLSDYNHDKNGFSELISDQINRVYLKKYSASDENSDHPSVYAAVYVDGVKFQNQYLATQLPTQLTINAFWQMVAELKVELILMLQPPDLQDPSYCAIIPTNGSFEVMPCLNIAVMEIVELKHYTSHKLVLLDNSEESPREQSVTILCLTGWKPGKNQLPPPVMTMVTFWQAVGEIRKDYGPRNGPIVTLCHDGVTGCGLYLALNSLLERMALERECDFYLAVQAVRRSRSDFIPTLAHLEYLYDAALVYLDYFNGYEYVA